MNGINIEQRIAEIKPHTILVVDDISENIKVLAGILSREGYDIAAATSADQAIQTLSAILPDLILLDILMPGTNGFELCEQLKTKPETADIPVIFLTAKTESEDVIKGFEKGGVDYITKPFNAKELLTRVRNHLELKKAKDSLKSIISRLEKTNAHLKESEALYSAMVNGFDGYIYVCSDNHVLEYMNRKLIDYVGYNGAGQICHKVLYDFHTVCPWCRSSEVFNGKCVSMEFKNPGDNKWYYAVNTPIKHADGGISKQTLILDITDRKLAEIKVKASEKRYRTVLESAPDPVVVRDTEGFITYVNSAFTKVFGWGADEVDGRKFDFMLIDGTDSNKELVSTKNLRKGRAFSGFETLLKTKFTSAIWTSMSGASFFNENNEPGGSILTLQDITARKNAEAEIVYIAFHDVLTGLPNRKSFYAAMEDMVEQARRSGMRNMWALLFLDLNNFKYINDTLGHDAGDDILKETALRLKNCLRKSDHVFRLGGDEFTIILTNVKKYSDIVMVIKKLQSDLAAPIHISDHNLFISMSIGISVYPEDGEVVEVLVKNADMAMYAAKEEGSGYRFFTEEMNRRALLRMKMESDLRTAIKNNEFDIYYQPLVDSDEEIIGMEALLRWNHPENGQIQPSNFISFAEETGLIIPIGEWVLYNACKQVKEWNDGNSKTCFISVNVSTRQFKDPEFTGTVKKILEVTGFPPGQLKLEVTESGIMDNPEEAIMKMNELRRMGIGFSIDDFGTGYSSLSYLKRFPIDALKIDKSFIKDSASSSGDREIVKTIIAMAENLGIKAVAEGVETLEQKTFLCENGCLLMQGFYFSKPMCVKDFESLMRKHRDDCKGI